MVSEILFFIGIILTVVSVIGASVAMITLTIYRKKLQEALERDYGKNRCTLR